MGIKDPSHLWALRLSTFSDACIIQMHRDPCKLIPSVASLVYTHQMVELILISIVLVEGTITMVKFVEFRFIPQ